LKDIPNSTNKAEENLLQGKISTRNCCCRHLTTTMSAIPPASLHKNPAQNSQKTQAKYRLLTASRQFFVLPANRALLESAGGANTYPPGVAGELALYNAGSVLVQIELCADIAAKL
jgi:hypothetical protein